jgi:prophage tail gpP-like protein
MYEITVNNIILQYNTTILFQNSLTDLRSCICTYIDNDNTNINIFDNVIIKKNNKPFLTGIVKAIVQNGSEKTLYIKSNNAILKDTCTPLPIEFLNCNLKDIVDRICNYFNLNVIYNTDITDYKINNEIDVSTSAKLDESAWDFLVRLCILRGLLIRDTENGLEIGKLKDKKDYFSFNIGEDSIINYNQVYNYDNLAKNYEVYGQFNGNHKETLTLNFIKQNTTKRIINNEVNSGLLKDFLNWYVCREIGKAVKITLTITSNKDLNVGDFVSIKDSSEKKFIIERIDESINNGIVLTLVLPCAYTGTIPEEIED